MNIKLCMGEAIKKVWKTTQILYYLKTVFDKISMHLKVTKEIMTVMVFGHLILISIYFYDLT